MTNVPESSVPEATQERGFRVVVFAAPDEPSDLGDVLARVLGLHPTDAIIHAHSVPGVLPDSLPEDLARRLADEITATGIQASAVSAGEVPSLDEAEVVHHARCGAHGLDIVGLRGESELVVPWTSVDLISVGQIPQEVARHVSPSEMTTVRSGRRTGPSTFEAPLAPGPEAWIVATNPSRIFRVDHKRMNYEYLADRKTDSATTNFRLFLEDLVARAGHAYRTPATRVFLQHGSVADYSFDSAEALQRSTVLHLLLHRQVRAGS